MLGGAFID